MEEKKSSQLIRDKLAKNLRDKLSQNSKKGPHASAASEQAPAKKPSAERIDPNPPWPTGNPGTKTAGARHSKQDAPEQRLAEPKRAEPEQLAPKEPASPLPEAQAAPKAQAKPSQALPEPAAVIKPKKIDGFDLPFFAVSAAHEDQIFDAIQLGDCDWIYQNLNKDLLTEVQQEVLCAFALFNFDTLKALYAMEVRCAGNGPTIMQAVTSENWQALDLLVQHGAEIEPSAHAKLSEWRKAQYAAKSQEEQKKRQEEIEARERLRAQALSGAAFEDSQSHQSEDAPSAASHAAPEPDEDSELRAFLDAQSEPPAQPHPPSGADPFGFGQPRHGQEFAPPPEPVWPAEPEPEPEPEIIPSFGLPAGHAAEEGAEAPEPDVQEYASGYETEPFAGPSREQRQEFSAEREVQAAQGRSEKPEPEPCHAKASRQPPQPCPPFSPPPGLQADDDIFLPEPRLPDAGQARPQEEPEPAGPVTRKVSVRGKYQKTTQEPAAAKADAKAYEILLLQKAALEQELALAKAEAAEAASERDKAVEDLQALDDECEELRAQANKYYGLWQKAQLALAKAEELAKELRAKADAEPLPMPASGADPDLARLANSARNMKDLLEQAESRIRDQDRELDELRAASEKAAGSQPPRRPAWLPENDWEYKAFLATPFAMALRQCSCEETLEMAKAEAVEPKHLAYALCLCSEAELCEPLEALLCHRLAHPGAFDGAALLLAARAGRRHALRILAQFGADPDACEGLALRECALRGDALTAAALIAAGANPSLLDSAALRAAAAAGHAEAFAAIARSGALLRAPGGKYWTEIEENPRAMETARRTEEAASLL